MQVALREILRNAPTEAIGVTLDTVSCEVPPRLELGDLAFPVAFELAKRIKQSRGEKIAPRSIAETLRDSLAAIEGVARVEIAGAGYINVFFDRARLLSRFVEQKEATPEVTNKSKRIVEHTNINPNKAAHIGHLRNAVLGDTFVRCMRATGEEVEVHNYIDNTGVQVADVVIGFMHLERMTLDDVRALDSSLPPEKPFDYYCWDLYARVGLFYRNGDLEAKEDAQKLELRRETLRLIEEANNPTAEIADYVVTRITSCHLDTMERLGIRYDVLPRESEILHFIWERAFEQLKRSGAIRFETEGRNKGCWVMPLDLHASTEEHDADKVIVRSNGTITYTGKDIAYQLWKLGQLDLRLPYKPFRRYSDGHTAWISTSNETEESKDAPEFGLGAIVYNVIDSRQSYTQEVVRLGVAAVAPEVGDAASVHVAYEMVALSPAASEELGIELSAEDLARSFVEMSGRKGLGVKADDLINRLESGALAEVETRHPALSEIEKEETARQLATGALRYFLLKWTRNSVIAFDFREALATEGETGIYCQYTAVRANSIFRKLDESERREAEAFILESLNDDARAEEINGVLGHAETGDELWSLASLAARLDEIIAQAAATAEPAHLAKYVFQLARAFNLFYHHHHIINEKEKVRRAVLLVIADFASRQLTRALGTLGIAVPARM